MIFSPHYIFNMFYTFSEKFKQTQRQQYQWTKTNFKPSLLSGWSHTDTKKTNLERRFVSVFVFFMGEQRQVIVKGWGKRWKEGEGVAFQWESWRKEMGTESAFEGERLSLIWPSLCLKKKTIVKGKDRVSGGRTLWKGKAWVLDFCVFSTLVYFYVFIFFLILTSFKSFGYIYKN